MGTTTIRVWHTVDEIKSANRVLGHHWFEADTMRFFRSRVLDGVIGGRYFISSEQAPGAGSSRCYTIREASESGSISTVGEFQGYASARQARAAATKLAVLAEGGAA